MQTEPTARIALLTPVAAPTGGRKMSGLLAQTDITQVVKDAYAAFQRRDIVAILGMVTDDVEWVSPGPPEAALGPNRFYGRDGVARFFEGVLNKLEFDEFQPQEYVTQGDRVVALGRYGFRVKETGEHCYSEWAMVFTLRGGKVARFHEYVDTPAILVPTPSG